MSASEWQSRRTGNIVKITDRRPRGDASSYTSQVKSIANVVAGKGDASSFTAYSGSVAYSAGTAANPVVPVEPVDPRGLYPVVSSDSPDTYYEIVTTNLGVSWNFTIECFAYITSDIEEMAAFTFGDILLFIERSPLELRYYSTSESLSPIIPMSPWESRWVHLAVVCVSNTVYLYLDGKNYASFAMGTRDLVTIGDGSYPIGRITNFRISNYARYTGTFTPSLPLTADAGTTLLLTDDFYGPGAGDVTLNGSAPTFTNELIDYTPYRPPTYPVVSGFSDTSYYTVPTTNLGLSGNFTIECFVFLIDAIEQLFTDIGYSLQIYSDGITELDINNLPNIDATPWEDRWVHLAIVQTGTTRRFYLDGILKRTFTPSLAITGPLSIGRDPQYSGGYFRSRLSNFRISSSAKYSSDFTPSLPLTADTDTTLLLSDGIYGTAAADVLTTGTPTFTNELINYTPYTPT